MARRSMVVSDRAGIGSPSTGPGSYGGPRLICDPTAGPELYRKPKPGLSSCYRSKKADLIVQVGQLGALLSAECKNISLKTAPTLG